ncbi:hypothetical protein AB685_22215 [Bacillus sp. LL01]|uniref:tripartite tricarboxylate transporter TctB family protein n=1 Tax=Bacillus sp. LL01 TaxID=1665556 RepID=UPI00064D5824|nr:tripartite tricarboxylate transporter TctB family protein [Bacillus sp. LL01]KMJ56394.1 hypothetical protein AB685_22215 [Bacillus sp. LL01]
MNRNMANLIASIVFIIIGTWFLYNTVQLPQTTNAADVGPRAFPLIMSISIIVFSIVLLVQTILSRKQDMDKKIYIHRAWSVVTFAALLIIFVLAIPRLGYYLSALIFFPLFIFATGEKSLIKVSLLTAGFLGFTKVAFDMLLGVPLP